MIQVYKNDIVYDLGKTNVINPESTAEIKEEKDQHNDSYHQHHHAKKVYLKYLDVIPSAYYPEMIKITQFTMRNVTNGEFKDLLNKKLTRYTNAHIKKSSVEKDKLEDPDLNFIGLPTYDIRVSS